jgi:hypothetical protein
VFISLEVQIRVRSGDSVVPDLAFERRTTYYSLDAIGASLLVVFVCWVVGYVEFPC